MVPLEVSADFVAAGGGFPLSSSPPWTASSAPARVVLSGHQLLVQLCGPESGLALAVARAVWLGP